MKKLVLVLLVEELLRVTRLVAVALVALRRAIVPEAEVRSLIFAVLMVVVAKVEVPITTKALVVVLLVTVKLSIKATAAEKRLEKKLVEVPLSTKRLLE